MIKFNSRRFHIINTPEWARRVRNINTTLEKRCRAAACRRDDDIISLCVRIFFNTARRHVALFRNHVKNPTVSVTSPDLYTRTFLRNTLYNNNIL